MMNEVYYGEQFKYDIYEALDRLEALYKRMEKPMTELRKHFLESEIAVQLEALEEATRNYKFDLPKTPEEREADRWYRFGCQFGF